MDYDVIIIGGGLSGLASGIALTKKKKKVILLEQHTTVGGLAAGFKRKGYYFDACMSRANVTSLLMPLKQAGIEVDINFIPHRCTYEIEGRRFTCDSVEGYFHYLYEIFHEESDGLKRLYKEQIHTQVKLLDAFMGGTDTKKKPGGALGILMKIPAMLKESASKENFNEILRKYLKPDGRAYLFLCERWDEVNYRGVMNPFTKTAKIYTQMKNAYPSGGFQNFCNNLAALITENGGEIRTRTKVTKIIVENGRCAGVEAICGGKAVTISSRNIVSAIDLNKAFYSLIGKEHISKEISKRLGESEYAASIPILYLGVNIFPKRLREALGGTEELLYYPKIRKQDESADEEGYFTEPNMIIHASSLLDSGHAPQGKSNIQIYLQHAPVGWLENWGVVDGKRTPRYEQIKKMVTEQVLDSLQKVLPELEDRSLIDVCELGTPYTIERYTGGTHGCACGFTIDGDKINSHSRGKFFDRLPGISGLYFCGHQTCWPGAAGSALASGIHSAKVIK